MLAALAPHSEGFWHLVGRNASAGFDLMEKMQEDFSVPEMADALEVSRSGFHAHCCKAEHPPRRQDVELKPLLRCAFAQSRRSYGSPRLRLELRALGYRCGERPGLARSCPHLGKRNPPVQRPGRDTQVTGNLRGRGPATHKRNGVF